MSKELGRKDLVGTKRVIVKGFQKEKNIEDKADDSYR
jgi:hypothetical protein|tara:strand:+ start:441 stop:551 length:111 start_codon:yes stop_codon:yes gene_type:complete